MSIVITHNSLDITSQRKMIYIQSVALYSQRARITICFYFTFGINKNSPC